MIQALDTLPKFKKPPVVEVVLATQFQNLPGMHVGHLGIFWEAFKDRFPRVEQHPPLPHVIERKGARVLGPLHGIGPAALSMLMPFALPRMWVISEDNCELIQLQADKFLRNWRRHHGPTIEYPTYDGHTRPNFERDLAKFYEIAKAQGLGTPVTDQCEITYINVIQPCGVWEHFAQFDRVFVGWSSNYPKLAESEAGAMSWRAQHEVTDTSGKFVGHLFLELDSAFSVPPGQPPGSEPSPIIQLQLTVRGRPLAEGIDGVMAFMDLGHRIIVNSFTDVTTPEMHAVWERFQ